MTRHAVADNGRWPVWLALLAACLPLTAQDQPAPAAPPPPKPPADVLAEANGQLDQAAPLIAEGVGLKQQSDGTAAEDGTGPGAEGMGRIDEAFGLWSSAAAAARPILWDIDTPHDDAMRLKLRLRQMKRQLLLASRAKPLNESVLDATRSAIFQDWLADEVFRPLHGGAFALALLGVVVAWFLFLAGLQKLGSGARRRLTVVCTFVAGLFYSVSFFWPRGTNPLKNYEAPLGQFTLVMGGFAIGLGVINLCVVHGKVLFRGRPGWYNSLAFFLGFIGMAVFGIWDMYAKPPDDQHLTVAGAGYRLLFEGLLTPLQATTFALLGFFIVSAAYRAFRIRSTEAALMTVVAFLVMLGQVPLGQAITAHIAEQGSWGWLRIENLTNWLLTRPSTAAFRGILFGSATGGFALSLRVWLSLERGSYFGKEF